MADVLRAGVELAVGKRARAALAELDVRAHVQLARCPEALDIAPSPLDAFAALEQDGPRAAAGEHQRREQSRRARADHHGAHGGRGDHRRQLVKGGRVDADAFVSRAAQHSFLVLERGGNGINKRHAIARVDAAAENVQRMEGRFDTQRRCGAFV